MAGRCSVVLAVLALALAVAGCGGGGKHGLTKEEYNAKVNHLCLLAADQFREMHLLNTMDDWQRNATEIVRIRMHFNKALAAVKPPPAIKTDAESLLVANKNAVDDDRYAIAAAQAGDRLSFFHALRADSRDQRAAHRAAVLIGAEGC